ncbi:MAG: FKBP-type peptidyl-prolyl cis-trans isomerase [Acidimicrobiales bacterium]|nr:FKBP-type peptidyl-prolyl cis-trans isomerase [Acidimicrobiales bacterium]
MVVTDLIDGCGAEIPEGAVVEVEVNYLGKALSTGDIFDSSFERGESISFPVGAGQLIQGWDTGLVGMKEGGRRQLLIPGDLAYGPAGSPPDIGPDDTLVFVIDLLSVTA